MQHRVTKLLPAVHRHFWAWTIAFAGVGAMVAMWINTASAAGPGDAVSPPVGNPVLVAPRHLPATAGTTPDTFNPVYAGSLRPKAGNSWGPSLGKLHSAEEIEAFKVRVQERGFPQTEGYWVESHLDVMSFDIRHVAVTRQVSREITIDERRYSHWKDISSTGEDYEVQSNLDPSTIQAWYHHVQGDPIGGTQTLMITGWNREDNCIYIKSAQTWSWSQAADTRDFTVWKRVPPQPPTGNCTTFDRDHTAVSAGAGRMSISVANPNLTDGIEYREYTIRDGGHLTSHLAKYRTSWGKGWGQQHIVALSAIPGRLNEIAVLGDDGLLRLVNPETGSVEELNYDIGLDLSVDAAMQRLSVSATPIAGSYRLAALTKSGGAAVMSLPGATQTCANKSSSETCAPLHARVLKLPHQQGSNAPTQPNADDRVKSVSFREDPLNPGKWLVSARTGKGTVWDHSVTQVTGWHERLFADPAFPVLSTPPRLQAGEKPLEWTMLEVNKDGIDGAIAIRTDKRMLTAPISSGKVGAWKMLRLSAGLLPKSGDGTGMTAFKAPDGRYFFLFNDDAGYPYAVVTGPAAAALCNKSGLGSCDGDGGGPRVHRLVTPAPGFPPPSDMRLAAPMFASTDASGKVVLDGISRDGRWVQKIWGESGLYINDSPDAPAVGGYVVEAGGVRSDQIERPDGSVVTVWTRRVVLADGSDVVEMHRGGTDVFTNPLPTWAVSIPVKDIKLTDSPTPVIAPDGSVSLFATAKGGAAGSFVVSHVDAKGVISQWATMNRTENCAVFGCTNEAVFSYAGGAAIAAGYVGGENGHYTYTVAAKNGMGVLVAFALQLNRKADGSIELQQGNGSSTFIPTEEQIGFGGSPFWKVSLVRDFYNDFPSFRYKGSTDNSFIAIITGPNGIYLNRIGVDGSGRPRPDSDAATVDWVGPINPGICHQQVKELGRLPYRCELKAVIDPTITPNAVLAENRFSLKLTAVDDKGNGWVGTRAGWFSSGTADGLPHPYDMVWQQHEDVNGGGSSLGILDVDSNTSQLVANNKTGSAVNHKQRINSTNWEPWHSTIDLKAPLPIF